MIVDGMGVPVKPELIPEIRPIAAANVDVRNGIPEGKGYIYDPKGRRREQEVAEILARIRALIVWPEGGGVA